MKVTLKNEVGEILEYVARLRGELVDDLVNGLAEEWLEEHYCENAATWEQARCLPSTVITNRRGELNERAAYQTMRSNMRRLSA